MMRAVPFYPNHEDGMRCMLATYRSIFDYFLHRKTNWDELAAFTGYTPGRAAWTLKSLVQFAAMGFDITMIESFDYRSFSKEGEAYLQTRYGPEELSWYLQHSNLMDIAPLIPAFLQTINHQQRSPELHDIDELLRQGRLVFVTVNSRVLNSREGYASHALLITDKVNEHYIAHDPGSNQDAPQADRPITADLLWAAMGGEGNTSEVTGFKLQSRRNLRLDQYVIERYPLLSRAYAVKLINQGRVLVDGKQVKAGYKLREQDDIAIDYDPDATTTVPNIELPILYEDQDCIVINKPAGVLTHSVGKLHGEATVATFLRSRIHDQPAADPVAVGIRNSKVNQDNQRAGIVHRLDRMTSGVIICAKNPQALSWLQKQFHDRTAQKTYTAIITGQLDPDTAIIDMPIERNPKAPATFRVGSNGKPAVTRYRTVRTGRRYSLIELRPETGRTHQLRVHLAARNHPIVGDFMYDGAKADRLYLHAQQLQITLPNGEARCFQAELPPEFNTLMDS